MGDKGKSAQKNIQDTLENLTYDCKKLNHDDCIKKVQASWFFRINTRNSLRSTFCNGSNMNHPSLKALLRYMRRMGEHIAHSLPIWGAGFVLLIGIVSMTSLTIDRTRTTMIQGLTDKGTALIRAFERSLNGHRGRQNMPSVPLQELRTQYLLETMADRNDVRFMAIVSPDGTILGHSDPKRVGEKLIIRKTTMTQEHIENLACTQQSQWLRAYIEGESAFVVYRFMQSPKKYSSRRPHNRHKMAMPDREALNPSSSILFLALDPAPLESAEARHRQWALTFLLIVISSSALMMFALYALQRIRTSRRSQQEAEALTNKLALTLPDGLILLDTRGRIVHMNQTAFELFQITKSPLGLKATEVLPPSLLSIIQGLTTEETLPNIEIPFLRSDGERILNIRGGNMNDPDIGRTGSLLLIRDVSEMRHLEREIRQREKMVALGKVAAGVAHELRNPLSSIKGYATYFGQLFPKDSDEQKAADLMVHEVERMGRAITDLIGLSRPSDIRPVPCDVRHLADEVLRLIQQDAISRNVTLRLEAAPVLPEALIDPDRMRQVLLNLCLNALEAMPQGGTLTLGLKNETLNDEHGYVTVIIKDTGSGIAPEDHAHVFDPYFTTKSQGTGLGLATVVKILEAHNAQIRFESTLGEGTSFYVRLPLPSVSLEQSDF